MTTTENALHLQAQLAHAEGQIARLKSLVEASKILNSSLELDELLKVIMELAVLELKADRATLYLIDQTKGELWSKVVQGPEMVEIRLPVGKGIAGLVAQTGKVINLPDAYDDPHFNPEIDRESDYRTQAMLTIPVRNKREEIIGVLQILNKKEGSCFTREDEDFFHSLAVHVALAVENALLYKEAREKKRFEEELALAGEIQRRLLPDHYPEIEGLEVADLSFPCRHVGGDYFDYLKLADGGFGCAVGDVSGKGMPAALLMANLQAGLRALVDGTTPITQIMHRLNKLLARSSATKKFATLFYGEIGRDHRLRYVNAGHIFPFLVDRDGAVIHLSRGGTIVGMFEEATYELGERELQTGDVIVLFTDGVTEARDPEGREFGVTRLVDFVTAHRALSPKRLVLELHREIGDFLRERPLEDDFTLVVIKAS